MNYKDLPHVGCILDVMGRKQTHSAPMMDWNFAYFHGKLVTKFDELCVGPGDLIQCSIDQYKFPLGMSLVTVNDLPAVAYIWEESKDSLFRDFCGNRYYRKPRHGLILAADDDEEGHTYALTCMNDRRTYL